MKLLGLLFLSAMVGAAIMAIGVVVGAMIARGERESVSRCSGEES